MGHNHLKKSNVNSGSVAVVKAVQLRDVTEGELVKMLCKVTVFAA
jgi:hypothetical protein